MDYIWISRFTTFLWKWIRFCTNFAIYLCSTLYITKIQCHCTSSYWSWVFNGPKIFIAFELFLILILINYFTVMLPRHQIFLTNFTWRIKFIFRNRNSKIWIFLIKNRSQNRILLLIIKSLWLKQRILKAL